MLESVIVGVLSLAGTVIGSFSGMRLMSYRIEQLEKKVDKHNNFAERMPVVEEKNESVRAPHRGFGNVRKREQEV